MMSGIFIFNKDDEAINTMKKITRDWEMKAAVTIALMLICTGCKSHFDETADTHKATNFTDGIAAYEMGDDVRCYVLRNAHISCVQVGAGSKEAAIKLTPKNTGYGK